MFIRKRSCFVRMACEAHLVLRSRGTQLTGLEPAVGIVAVGAFHQAFVNAMVERPVELLFLVQMARVAKIRLLHLQKVLALFGMVRIVAVRAAYPVLQVHRTRVIPTLLAILMAVEAAS